MSMRYRWWNFYPMKSSENVPEPIKMHKPTILYAVAQQSINPMELAKATILTASAQEIISFRLIRENLIMAVGTAIKNLAGTTLYSGAPQNIWRFDLDIKRAVTYDTTTNNWYILQLNDDGSISTIKHLTDRTNQYIDADFQNNIIVENYEQYLGNGNWRYHLVRYDNDGNVVWDKTDVPNWSKPYIVYNRNRILLVRYNALYLYDLDGNQIARYTPGTDIFEPLYPPVKDFPLYYMDANRNIVKVTADGIDTVASFQDPPNISRLEGVVITPLIDPDGNDYGAIITAYYSTSTGGINKTIYLAPNGSVQTIRTGDDYYHYSSGFLPTSTELHFGMLIWENTNTLKIIDMQTGEVIYSEEMQYSITPKPIYGEEPAIFIEVTSDFSMIGAYNYMDMHRAELIPFDQRVFLGGSPAYLVSKEPLFVQE